MIHPFSFTVLPFLWHFHEGQKEKENFHFKPLKFKEF